MKVEKAIFGKGLEDFRIDQEVFSKLSMNLCRSNSVVGLGYNQDRTSVFIGAIDVSDKVLFSDIAEVFKCSVTPVQLNNYEVTKALSQSNNQKVKEELSLKLKELRELDFNKKSIAEYLDMILSHAVTCNASDIHFEVYEDDTDLRYRIDGVLVDISTPISVDMAKEFVSRVKVLAGLDIANSMISQDGRVKGSYVSDGYLEEINFRVSVIPGLFGEDVVFRVLRSNTDYRKVEDLGLGRTRTKKLKELLSNPEGLILVTGPTGSGKTTTLYSSLEELAGGGKKILTVEDPVERVLANVNQKQVSMHMEFKDYARSFLRQDPNVILIGEIRDSETANMALRAAQNGALVMSSLHTADALRSVSRMYSLGADWDLLVNSLLASINQRLLRKLCEHCKVEYKPTGDEVKQLRLSVSDTYYTGKGCDKCLNTGYKGRIAVYEMLVMNDSIISALKNPEDLLKVKKKLIEAGFKTLYDDALKKAKRGETSVQEILRCIPYRIIN